MTITKTGNDYKVTKMRFDKKFKDRSVIIFNNDITISDIPEKAYQYIVNGKSAIELIIDQYRIKVDKKSGIVDDPKYIFNLLLRIISVYVQTVDLINQLPPLATEK